MAVAEDGAVTSCTSVWRRDQIVVLKSLNINAWLMISCTTGSEPWRCERCDVQIVQKQKCRA